MTRFTGLVRSSNARSGPEINGGSLAAFAASTAVLLLLPRSIIQRRRSARGRSTPYRTTLARSTLVGTDPGADVPEGRNR